MQHYCLFSKGAKVKSTVFNDVVMPTHPRRRRVVTAFAVLSLIVMPLSSLGVATAASASGSKSPSSGCGVGSPKTAILSLKIDGINRTVIVHVPTTYTNTSKLPLVLNLHGSGSTAAQQDVFSGMDETADEDNFIVAFPQALIPDGTGYDWNVPGVPLVGGRAVPAGSPNDVKFLTNLVGVLEHMYCVNPMAVYATGFSGGAREVSQLACDDSKIFAAVAPVSGLRHPTPCPATRAVPVIAFHGSDDLVDPFAGKGEAYWTYSVQTAAKDWAKQDHCSTSPTVSKSTGVVFTSYSTCAKGTAVELYEVIGEGHEWPGGPSMPSSITSLLGPQSNAVNANSVMWSFFASHQL
jgi:polyhydroxybutyrate depolymerase